MVGATRGFITRPLAGRAVLNGVIASAIAILLLVGFISTSEKYIPYLKALHNTKDMILIFSGILFLGICITVFSTYRSAIKYLKMKLDELY